MPSGIELANEKSIGFTFSNGNRITTEVVRGGAFGIARSTVYAWFLTLNVHNAKTGDVRQYLAFHHDGLLYNAEHDQQKPHCGGIVRLWDVVLHAAGRWLESLSNISKFSHTEDAKKAAYDSVMVTTRKEKDQTSGKMVSVQEPSEVAKFFVQWKGAREAWLGIYRDDGEQPISFQEWKQRLREQDPEGYKLAMKDWAMWNRTGGFVDPDDEKREKARQTARKLRERKDLA